MGRLLRYGVMMLLALMSARATAQDIPGLEVCTAEKQMARRTGCLQGNDQYLQQALSTLARETDEVDPIGRTTGPGLLVGFSAVPFS